jgi:cytidylate kinase
LWEHLGEQLTGEREAYVSALRAVVTELALQDDVVIVGHGAGLFLTDMRTVVRVFVVAPMAQRLARLQTDGIQNQATAQKIIDQQDRESADYVRYLFDVNWLDPHQCDLVINTGRADTPAALDMLVSYTRSLVRDETEAADLTHKQIASRVEQAVVAEDLGVDKLGVYFDADRLVLEGDALTHADRERAESLARALAPDVNLDDRIVVRPPSSA